MEKGKIIIAKQFRKIKTLLDKHGNVIEEVVTEPGGNDYEARRKIGAAIRANKGV